MRVGGFVALGLVSLFLASGLSAVLAGDLPGPDAGSPFLQVGSPDQMKTRNVLTPFAWTDRDTMAVLARVYDTAVQRNATDGSIVPRLAVGVDGDGDGVLDPAERGRFDIPAAATSVTVFYDFTNARFHDGVSVSEMDLLFSYHAWALNPKTSGLLRVLMDQGGGPASNHSTTRWLWVLPVADGDADPATAALQFRLQFPYTLFAHEVLGVAVLPRHIWEGTGGGRHEDFGRAIYPEGDPRMGQGIPLSDTMYTPFNFLAAAAWQVVDSDVIGSGHFRFGTWAFGAFARLDANLDYAFGPPKVAGIMFKIYRTTQLLVFALQSGDIDFIFANLPPEFLPDLRNHPAIRIVETPALFPVALSFNLRRMPMGYDTYPPVDRTVDGGHPLRQAFAHLIDATTIVRILLQEHGLIADSMVSPDNDGWHNGTLPQYDYDHAQATLLLDNEGWTDTDGDGWREFPRLGDSQINLLTPQADYDPIRASMGAMIASAARSVGINLNSRPTAFGALLAAVEARDFDLAVVEAVDPHAHDPWTLYRGDPDYLFEFFHSSNAVAGLNTNGFWDGPFDSAAELSRRSMDYLSRETHVKYEQGILAERLPMIPVYYRNLIWAYRADRFTGWRLIASTLFNYWSLQDLEANKNIPPEIILVSPTLGSLIRPGTPIDLDVRDTNLVVVEYSVDGVPPGILPDPYDVPTDSWADGDHLLAVRAADPYTETIAYYAFRVDGTPPAVVFVSPANGSRVAAGRVPIEVRFSEAVNRTSAEAAFSIVAGPLTWGAADGTFMWANNSTSFRFDPSEPLPEGTVFEVRLAGTLTDGIGNPMGPAYTWRFTTPGPPVQVALLFGGIAVIVLAVILSLLVLVVLRRRRRPSEPPR